jgi:hypothetical protein
MVRKTLIPILLGAVACCSPACGFTPPLTASSAVRLDLQITEPLQSTDGSPVTLDNDEKLMDLPPVIQQIANDQREFQMNLGKAMDTLRKDMPYILKESPGKQRIKSSVISQQ